MKMKKIFATSLLLLSAAAFVACSNDDDDTPGPSVKYDVISFEPSTGMIPADSRRGFTLDRKPVVKSWMAWPLIYLN